jgi:hypothetical protein
MLLHWIFVLSGLIQLQKRIQNPFENCSENFEKKKQRDSPFLSVFGPAIRPACSLPHPRSALLPP